jgi:PA domain/Secretion system C-terminal sorting domain
MKKLFTFLTVILAFQMATAQYVLVNSPAGFAGSKVFAAASFGRALTDSIWTADVVYVNDGSANGAIGCAALTNGVDLAGKIALIDRGSCNFSSKVDKAQAAGAIAAIVFNTTAGGNAPIVMGTTAGFTITIPAAMLSYDDGQLMRAALMNGPVNMTIGNVKFPNDIHVDKKLVLNPLNGTTPLEQAIAGNLSFAPGVAVVNNGLNNAFGIKVQGVIEFTPAGGSSSTVVYDKTGTIAGVEKDSTRLVELPVFTPTSGEGVYSAEYTITSDSVDNVVADNTISSEFMISNNVFSKARFDAANGRPFQTNAYRPSTSTLVEFMSGFTIPKGVGNSLDSMKFYLSTTATDLTKLQTGTLNVFLYEWNDTDLNNDLSADEFVAKAIQEVTFTVPGGYAGIKSAWVNVPLEDLTAGLGVKIPTDNKTYFVGVRYTGDSTVFFGFDEDIDQTATIDLSPSVLVGTKDLGYFFTTTWDANDLPDLTQLGTFTGTRGAFASALYVNKITTGIETQLPSNVSIRLMPNPVSDEMIAEVDLVENVISIEYTILDAAGRLVSRSFNDVNSNLDKAVFNVSQLASGAYFLKVTTEKGSKTTAFQVKH